jgi:hypothetical protein
MAHISTLTVTVHLRWWVIPYMRTVAMLCILFHAQPNWNRVTYWLMRGLYVKR